MKKTRLLFVLTYMVSYLTRLDFGAILVEMHDDLGIASSLLSLAITGSFITYGTGQLISGYLGDRIQPKRLVAVGLAVTSCMNLMVPFCKNPWTMMVLWCINGLAQSFLWPPIVRLMASLFEEKEYQKVTTAVVRGGSIGTVLIYLLSPLWILISGWRLVFWISATLGTGMLFMWLRHCPDIKQEPGMKEGRSESGMQFLKSPLIWGIMVAIVLQGALKDGVTTWMPSYISETFRFSNSASILSGILLPVLAILSVQAASYVYSRRSKAPLFSSGAIFLLGAVMAVLLRCFSGKNAAGSIFCMAMLSGCMHGVNLILVCILPVFFKSSGRVSTVSGVLNSCTYVGSAVSVYGIARMAEHSGWNATIVLWIFLALGGMILCLTGIPAWKKRFGK